MVSNAYRKLPFLLVAALLFSCFTIVAPNTTSAAPSEPYHWQNVVTNGGGGFIPGIIFSQSEQDLIYARTDIGGAYRWNAANETWVPLLDFVGWDDWGKLGVDALAADPIDPDRVYAAVGTYTNSWDPNNGYILRSTDRGDTWQETELPFKVGGNMPGRSMGERLQVDPNDNSILYFGARSGNGLWKSTDYGATWSKVTSFPNAGTYVQDPSNEYQSDIMGLAWITFDPTTGTPGNATQTIYVGVADLSQSVYRSTDGGTTWQAVPGQPTGYLPHHGILSSTGQLYISYSDGIGPYDGTKGEVWKLNTQTGTWTNISPVPDADNYFGYGGLAVDKQQPNTIMVASLNSWWPDAIIFRSTDGGASWSRIWDWDGYPNRTLRYTHDISAAPWLDFEQNPTIPEISPKLGWMIGDLQIDPFNSNRMMYGTGATIYGTKNLTAWDNNQKITLEVMAQGIEETAVQDLVSPPTGPPLVSAMYDVTGFRHDDLLATPSKMMTNPNSSLSIDFAELNPNFFARVGTADYAADPNAKSIGFSYDSAANWNKANSEPAGTAGGGNVAVSADGNAIVWSTKDVGVYYSHSGGNSWTASTGVPAGAQVRSDRVNPDKFYASINGAFYTSTNGGASFTQTAATGLPTEGTLNFKAMPGREGDIWLAGGSDTGVYGLWHSTDSGQSFSKLTNVQEADTVGFGKAAPGQTYMALYITAKIDNERGIYRSDDAGASWVRINDDEHQYGVPNTTITGDPRVYGRVYLGTNGRGILFADPVNGSGNPGGPDPVQSSTISPVTASFDKKQELQADIHVTMLLNGNTLQSIRNGSYTLISGADYSVNGATVTLSKAYLSGLPIGNTTLSFQFSAGTSPTLLLTIQDSTAPEPGEHGELKVEMYNGGLSSDTVSINPRIRLTNTGSSTLALSDISLRYYYTADGTQQQSFFCDWSHVGSANVQGSFHTLSVSKPNADTYLNISFTSAAGSLAPNESIELQIRFSKQDWTNYSQSNDYSFHPTATTFVENSKLTAYMNSTLQWGVEP